MTPPPLFGLLGLLALARHGGGGGDGGVGVGVGVGVGAQQPPGPIDGDAYFYGQSEPVYPSPGMTGGGTWTDAHAKALAFVGQLTLEEKVGLTTGQKLGNGCVGGIGPISRLAFPGLCLADAGQGLRGTDLVSGWPAGLHVGASWNRDLARRRAAAMGREFFAKGVNILLGPVVGPIGRVVSGGRNWEGFSPDPYLTGGMAYESVVGIQSAGVLTSTKHYIGNEQETNRSPSRSTGTEAVSSNIDDRTMHELYLWPFQDAVRAGSGNIMCSSQRENNSYGCANSKTLNGLLKTELAFQGFVVSDWGVQYAGVATALAGLDMVMPDSDLWGDRLVEAVRNGSVPDTRLNDMATRIMANWYYLKQDSLIPSPGLGLPADVSQPHRLVEARNASDRQILLDGAIEGHVLVKNTDGALPLRKPRILSIYGYSAKSPARWMPPGTAWLLGLASCDPAVPIDFITPPVGPLSQIASNGTLFVGGGSGANTPALISAPLDALQERARRDDTALFWDLSDGNEPVVQAASDACLVLVNAMASEGYDRTGLRDDYTDRLILHVAARCANTIVVMHNAGVRLVDGFVDHPNVTALLLAHLPGQDSGRALVALLHGDANPSGKLPYSLAAREEDYGAVLRPDLPSDDSDSGSGSAPTRFPQSDFVEGVFIDYRALDARNITPRYEFGFGLSYTTFSYADLTISSADSAINTGPYPTGPIQPGGPADLWDVLASVTATVTNTGAVAGADVAQLYVGIPSDDDHDDPAVPLRQLRGFRKPFLAPGASATVRFDLTRRDLSVWDVVAQRWALRRGSYAISVGPSSRQLPLRGTLTLV